MLIQTGQIGVALIHTLLGLVVLRGRTSSLVNRAFAAQSLVFAGWVLGLSGLHNPNTVPESFALAFGFASLIPVGFVMFSHCYPAATSWSPPRYVRILFLLGATFAVLSVGSNLILYDAELASIGASRKPGALYPAFALYFVTAWCIGLWIFARKWHAARGHARTQYHYLGAGLIGGSIGGITTNLVLPLLTGQSTYSWLGAYFSLVYVGFVAHAIIRHRLMALRVFIHRGLTIALAIILSAIPMCVLFALFWPNLLTSLDSSELALLLTTVSVVTVLIPITRDVASRLLDRYVYRTHADYQRTVREASQILTRVLNLDELLSFITTAVIRSTGAWGVAIYLRQDAEFRCATVKGRNDVEYFEAPPRLPTTIVRALETAHAALVTDEPRREPDSVAAQTHAVPASNNLALLLPVLSEDTLIAVIAVGPKLSGDSFYQQDLDLLMTLANQAGIAIKNAQLYAAVLVANEYLENIVATLESGVVAIDASGHIAIFNRAAELLTGLSSEDSRNNLVAVLPACLAEPLLGTVRDGEPRMQPEIDLPSRTPAGASMITRPVICTTSPIRDPSGSVLGAVAVFSDLSPLKELVVQRRNAERLTYFQALASGIAHEIKNPLVAIKTFTQLLPRRRGDPRFLEDFGRISLREIERMQRLVDRLRTLSTPGGGPRHPIDLRAPLTDALDVVRPMMDEKSVMVSVTLPEEPCIIIGNAAELEQLFLNLLLNAYDATSVDSPVGVQMNNTKGQVTVAISDSGPGIAPELIERVFEPFFTTKAGGSGLGLAISSSIALMHGARILILNNKTGGATFCVEFPLAVSASPAIA